MDSSIWDAASQTETGATTGGKDCVGSPAPSVNAAMAVIGDSDAVLLGNHGIVCCGTNIASAFGLARNAEYLAQLQYQAECIGRPNILSKEQMAEVLVKFQSYGQPGAKKTGY